MTNDAAVGAKSRPPTDLSRLDLLIGETGLYLLNLPETELATFLKGYAASYGLPALEQVKSAISAWRLGQRAKMGRRTIDGLISQVAKQLTPEQKLAFLRGMLSELQAYKDCLTLTVKYDYGNKRCVKEAFDFIDKNIRELRLKDDSQKFAVEVIEAAALVVGKDLVATGLLLRELVTADNKLAWEQALKEVELVKETIKRKGVKSLGYKIELPSAVLEIKISKPKVPYWVRAFIGIAIIILAKGLTRHH